MTALAMREILCCRVGLLGRDGGLWVRVQALCANSDFRFDRPDTALY